MFCFFVCIMELAIIMKMNYRILIVVISMMLISCGRNEHEKKLYGKWYELESDVVTLLDFNSDSLRITDSKTQSVSWTANQSKIKFDYNTWEDGLQKTILEYNLSATKDTLFTKLVEPQGEQKFNLIRADSYIDFLNKKSRLKFNLPKSDTSEFIEFGGQYGLKIFIGYSQKNNIIKKTQFSDDLTKLKDDIKKFKNNLLTGIAEMDIATDYRFHFRVFADKDISDSIITKSLSFIVKSDLFKTYDYPRPPNDTLSIKIYRIYQTKEENNLDILKGIRLKTNANIVYN